MSVGDLAEDIGKGLLAGFAATAAMTVSSAIEQRLRDRPASTAPADAAAKVLGIKEFYTDAARNRFGILVHWAYGSGWGAARGLLSAAGLGPAKASAAHLAAVWGSEQAMLPALAVAPPLTEWGAREIAIDLWHHLVYTTAASIAYELLDGR